MKTTNDIENKILYRFGVLFSKKRKELGMSMRELSRESGVSPSVIVDLENSKSLPSIKILIRLCVVLSINFNEISECLRVLGTEPSSKESNLVIALTECGFDKEQVKSILNYAEYIKYTGELTLKDTIEIQAARKMTTWVGTDSMGRNFVAGGAGSGKSAILKGIAYKFNYPYFTDEEKPWNLKPMTCQEFINLMFDSNVPSSVIGGIVLDCDVKKHLTDFHTYKWDFPVYYRIQTNRMGKINFKDFAYFKLKHGEE